MAVQTAYLGLRDLDFGLVLQLARVATRQVEDAEIRAHKQQERAVETYTTFSSAYVKEQQLQ